MDHNLSIMYDNTLLHHYERISLLWKYGRNVYSSYASTLYKYHFCLSPTPCTVYPTHSITYISLDCMHAYIEYIPKSYLHNGHPRYHQVVVLVRWNTDETYSGLNWQKVIEDADKHSVVLSQCEWHYIQWKHSQHLHTLHGIGMCRHLFTCYVDRILNHEYILHIHLHYVYYTASL